MTSRKQRSLLKRSRQREWQREIDKMFSKPRGVSIVETILKDGIKNNLPTVVFIKKPIK